MLSLGDINASTEVQEFKQTRTKPSAGKSNIRFIHALSTLNTPLLDVQLKSVNLASDLDYKSASAYTTLSPTNVDGSGETITFDLVQGGVIIVSGNCKIHQNTNYEAVLAYTDFNSNPPTIFCHHQ